MENIFNAFEATNTVGVSEFGKTFEDYGNSPSGYEFDDNQTNYLEDTLRSEGISDIQDLSGLKVEDLVSSVDKRMQSLSMNIPTKVHMGYFGEESNVWKEFRNRLEPKYLEAPSDKIQQEQIADVLCNTDELRLDNWKNLSLEDKVASLNQLEKRIADIEHRPATVIRSEEMNDDDLFGYQLNGDIAINEKVLMASNENPVSLDKLLETLVHEGRHAYQQYNVNERIVHQSKAQVETWRENCDMIGYWDGEPIRIPIIGSLTYTNTGLEHLGARLYYYQPVEIDARVFASDTMSAYHNKLNA